MTSLDPVRHVVLLEELDAGGVRVVTSGGASAVAREPRGIRLADVPADQVDELVTRLLDAAPESSAIEGEGEVAERFANAWAVAVGKQVEERGGVRLYRLGRLRIPDVQGEARPAGKGDADLCAGWLTEMEQDEDARRGWTVARSADEDERVRVMIAQGRLWMLEAGGRPVAMAAHRPPQRGVVRLGPIYTPPEFRRRGYGAALTALVARNLQPAEVCLRTDLGNPHSHGVYQQLGFETVADLRRFQLSSID
ncbi:GNAT family N-acetyltransferase [Kribbella sp. HUAS MG21]|uniref:GNAT family N-acetyltransferase n=1 Tax=Kribbella sp. HUAS MG21 TaxID=3160966 RepID=A0AAU7TMF1_9ACTN